MEDKKINIANKKINSANKKINSANKIYMVMFRAKHLKHIYHTFKYLKTPILAIYRNSKYDRGLHFVESTSIESIKDSLLRNHIAKIYPDPIEVEEYPKIFNTQEVEQVTYEINDQVNFKIASITRTGTIKKFMNEDKTRAVIQLTGNQMLMFQLDVSKLSKIKGVNKNG